MPLTDDSKHLLHEIYQVPYTVTTVISGGFGSTSVAASAWDYQIGVRDQLAQAIDVIDSDETMVRRVTELLTEYKAIATDRSDIDRNGYRFRASRNLAAIYEALYPYTGIVMRKPGRTCHQIPLG